MASITSMISLFVLLLATYCYSVPLPTKPDCDVTTSDCEMSTSKPFSKRGEMMGLTPEEQTTMKNKRTVDEDDDTELTTGYPLEMSSIPSKKRAADDYLYTTIRGEKLSKDQDSESDEVTTVRNIQSKKRHMPVDDVLYTTMVSETSSPMMNKKRSNEVEEVDFTTEYSYTTIPSSEKRDASEDFMFTTITDETSSPMMNKKRSDDFEKVEFTTEESYTKDPSLEKRDASDVDVTSESTHREPDLETEFYTTMESSTEFNDRVVRGGKDVSYKEKPMEQERYSELEMTTPYEPSSAADAFGKSTGLLGENETSTTDEDGKVRPLTDDSSKTETTNPGKITNKRGFSENPSETIIADTTVANESEKDIKTLQ